MHQERIDRIFELTPKGVNSIVIMGGPALRYTTGAKEGIAVLKPAGAKLVVHAMSELQALDTGLDYDLMSKDGYGPALRRILGRAGKVGIMAEAVTVAARDKLKKELPGKKLVDVSSAIMEASYEKDDQEIKLIRKACQIASDVAEMVPGLLKYGMAEQDLITEISYQMAIYGADGSSFGGIVAFGKNTAYPHAPTGKTKLKKGALVMVDFGAKIDGYGSDITRTFVFGRATRPQREMYCACSVAHEMALDLTREGKDVKEINEAVNEFFEENDHGPFIHSIGHALGILGGGFVNRPGAVNTVEPGIYVPDVGGVRIEDDIFITEPGEIEFLTHAPRDRLIEV